MELRDETTEVLMRLARDGGDKDTTYAAENMLFRRWREGVDVGPLIALLQSEKSRDRSDAAYYLFEIGCAVEALTGAVIALAEDPLAACRRAFVTYMSDAGSFDEAIAQGMAKCLLDQDLSVRLRVIQWAIKAGQANFEMFSNIVESGMHEDEPRHGNPYDGEFWAASRQKRTSRAMEIIRHVRGGGAIKDVRSNFAGEDSLVLDGLVFWETSEERRQKWRADRMAQRDR